MNFLEKTTAPVSSRTAAACCLNPSLLLATILICLAFVARAADPTTVQLAWSPSPDVGVIGYRIYYGVSPSQYTNSIAVGNVTVGTISGLVNGVTYYFATTAYTASDVQSPFSNEISYKPAFSQLQARLISPHQMVLTIQGQVGHNYDIEATQDFVTWTVIGTATPGDSGNVEFTDTNAASFSKRFYRLRDKTP